MRSPGPWLPLLVLLAACTGGEERNEAQLLLDRYGRLEQPSLEARRQAVDAFRALGVRSERVRAAQTACGAMQDALLRAEEATRAARVARSADEGEPALARSAAALVEVERHKPACDRALAALRARHAPR
ncbi:MAG: hypothetical protein AAF447_01760 [Myxococcota bacterium]